MLRIIVSLSVVGMLIGCATSGRPYDSTPVGEVAALESSTPFQEGGWQLLARGPYAEPYGATEAFAIEPEFRSSPTEPAAATLAAPRALIGDREERKEGENFLMLKGGSFTPDESDLDTGYIVNLGYGHYFNKLLAIELEAGYAAADPDASSADLYFVPVMANGRVSIPLWILEVYGGLGIGTVYYNADLGSTDRDGWLWAGNAFLGTNLVLFDKLTGGLELKYYVTDETNVGNDTLSGLALMLTLGWRL